MKLYIRNMVSIRCKMWVKSIMESLGEPCVKIDYGEIELPKKMSVRNREIFREQLRQAGFDLVENDDALLIERTRRLIIQTIHYSDALPAIPFTKYLNDRLGGSYSHTETLFSEVKGMTVERFIDSCKIEKAKELLLYENFTLEETADWLRYASIAELSEHFERITGLPLAFIVMLKHHRELLCDHR